MNFFHLVFRREPLLKVSMNVRVQPTVRITFVPEENVLRCILKEMVPPAEGEDGVPKQEVAIYVIKVRVFVYRFKNVC